MAYGGKPSRGCQMCRIRRIKCDETKPSCNQCARARRKCPGYRHLDTAASTSSAFTQSSSSASSPSSSSSSSPASPSPSSSKGGHRPDLSGGKPLGGRTAAYGRVAASSSAVVESATVSGLDAELELLGLEALNSPVSSSLLRQPLRELATCHFISNYVLVPRQWISSARGFHQFLLPLLKQDPPSPHFQHAFDACALASFNNRIGTGNEFDKEALGRYTEALAATAVALKNPVTAVQDSTLATILLLGLFENITAKSLGMLAWSSHIEGAIQLVKARGRAQLQTKIGMDLFLSVRTQMIIHSLSTGKSPNMGIEWWRDELVDDDYAAGFQQLSSRTGELRNEVNRLLATVSRTEENMDLMRETIRRCQNLDREITSWLNSLPQNFKFKTVAWEEYNPKNDYSQAEAFPGRIDLYRDLMAVNSWNVMRCMRIILASLIIRSTAWVILPADYRTSPEYAATARTCVEAITDIIASIPFQLGLFSRRKDLGEQAALSGFACGDDNARKGLAGYFLLWPLTCIQGQDYLTDLQRTWVKGRLKCIGDQLGVRYGNLLSQLNVRMPSMLILRDRLMNNPRNVPADVDKIVVGRSAAAAAAAPARQDDSAGMSDDKETMHRRLIQRKTEELKKKAVEGEGSVDDWTVKTWLQL